MQVQRKSQRFAKQKIDYIHFNPVSSGDRV